MKSLTRRCWFNLFTVVLTAACSSDPASEANARPAGANGSPDPDAGVTADPLPSAPSATDAAPGVPPLPATTLDACAAFAATYCSTLAQKATDILSNYFVDEASCRTFRLERCLHTDNAPDTGWTIALRAQCTAAVPSATVQDLAMLTIPACQDPPGKKADATACMFSAQCTSGHCRRADSAADCGACGPVVKTGDACTNYTDCGPREDCIAKGSHAIQRCVPIAAVDVGEACVTMDGCSGSRYCKGTYVPSASEPTGWTVVGGTCQSALPTKIGAGCGSFYADLGDGKFELTDRRQCISSISWCKLAPGATTGTCVALATAGQPCGDGCGGTLTCQSGICAAPVAASCK